MNAFPASKPSAGVLYYDGACPLCLRWVKWFGFIVRQGGFDLVAFQSDQARRDLGLLEGESLHEMKLRLTAGPLLGGVDACAALAEAAGWCAPVGWLLRAPVVNGLAWRVYRRIAANRYCMAGQCHASGGAAVADPKECP
jgi:predicted DCC family thiol-disulfide oxidoreductase YuxK